MKIYTGYPGGITKITNDKGFYQTEDLVNVISVYVNQADVTWITYTLALEFLRADGRKTTIYTEDRFASGEATTLTEENVTYDIHNFTLTNTQLAVAGALAFTCYINILNSGVVEKRGVLFNAVSNVRKTVTYSANTIFVVSEDDEDVPIIVADMKTAIETLSGQLASKVNKADIADNLTTNDSSKVLSAKQGKVLKDTIDGVQEELDSIQALENLNNIVGTYAELEALITIGEATEYQLNAKVQVLNDSTHDNNSTLYNLDSLDIENGLVQNYIWRFVGYYDGYNKEQIDEIINDFEQSFTDNFNELSEQLEGTLNEQTETIEQLGQLQPKGVDTENNILGKLTADGIWIGSDTGHWYYWNGTKYVDGGVYQTAVNYDELEKDINGIREYYGRNLFYFERYSKGEIITRNSGTIEFINLSTIKLNGTFTANTWLYTFTLKAGTYTLYKKADSQANNIPIVKLVDANWNNEETKTIATDTVVNIFIFNRTYNNATYYFSIVNEGEPDFTEGGTYSAIDKYARDDIEKLNTLLPKKYNNPICMQSSADPCLIQDDNLYYMFVTGETIQGFRSNNLIDWEHISTFDTSIFNDMQADLSFTPNRMWAPHVIKYKDMYHMFAVVVGHYPTTENNAIVHLTSGTLEGMWKYRNVVLSYASTNIKDAIDPCVVIDNDGSLKILFGAGYGIYCGSLDENYQLINNSIVLIHNRNDDTNEGARLEAATIFAHNGYYYLFTSMGRTAYGGNYKITIARSTQIEGPYYNKQGENLVDNGGSIILVGDTTFTAPGHNSDVIVDKDGNCWLLYHAWYGDDQTTRYAMLQQIFFDENGFPYFKDGVAHSATRPKL